MAVLTQTDIEMMRRIDTEQSVPSNYIVRLELLGVVRDEPSGLRLTIEGRRMLRTYKAPDVATVATSRDVVENDKHRIKARLRTVL